MAEEEEIKVEHKISKVITEMDEELRDRFKALKSIQDEIHDFDEEEQKEIRKLEVIYEEKYKEIYNLREQFVSAKIDLDSKLIEEFDARAKDMKDADYDKLEVVPCDVKAIQNTPKGISDFWVKALLNHPMGGMITEKDRPILGYLTNIGLELHSAEKGEGYDLIFSFQENSYFEGTEIRKELVMKHKGVLEKTSSTEIKWKDNASNPTLKKQKKKKKGKKVTVEVKADSFFDIFEEIDMNKIVKKDNKKADEDDDEEGDEVEELQMKLQGDLENADQLKDDLVPLALEYYLGVIENEEPDDDSDGEGGSDSDDDKPKKKKGKKGQDQMPLGPDGKP